MREGRVTVQGAVRAGRRYEVCDLAARVDAVFGSLSGGNRCAGLQRSCLVFGGLPITERFGCSSNTTRSGSGGSNPPPGTTTSTQEKEVVMKKTRHIEVTVQFDGDYLTNGERTIHAASKAFEKHPDALYVSHARHTNRIENRDGEPFPVSITTLTVALPDTEASTDK